MTAKSMFDITAWALSGLATTTNGLLIDESQTSCHHCRTVALIAAMDVLKRALTQALDTAHKDKLMSVTHQTMYKIERKDNAQDHLHQRPEEVREEYSARLHPKVATISPLQDDYSDG